PPIIEGFFRKYPRVVLRVDQVETGTLELPGLRERKFDLVLGRISTPTIGNELVDDLNVEILFDDRLVVVAGMQSQWARRRKIDLAELVNERWILGGPDSGPYRIVSDAFRGRGLNMPKISLVTSSVYLRTNMVASGHFITTSQSSVVHFWADRLALKVLPVDLPMRPWPLAIVTLKNRMLSPVVARFIEYLREFTQAMRVRGPVAAR